MSYVVESVVSAISACLFIVAYLLLRNIIGHHLSSWFSRAKNVEAIGVCRA